MANLDFFAAREDQIAVLEFVHGETDLRVFESYSEPGEDLREFASPTELTAAFDVGSDPHGGGTYILLQLWSPSVMDELHVERIELDPRKCEGHTFRYRVGGWGLIQLYLGGVYGRALTACHYGHNTEKRAMKWEHADGVQWAALKKLSNRIQYHVRGRLAVAKVPGRPILPAAMRLVEEGYSLLHFEGIQPQPLKPRRR